jgi:hypothetical protein
MAAAVVWMFAPETQCAQSVPAVDVREAGTASERA